MDRKIFSKIEIGYDPAKLSAESGILEGTKEYGELMMALALAERCVRPRAVIRRCSIAEKDCGLLVAGKSPESGELTEMLRPLTRCGEIVLGIITAGDEIDYVGAITSEKIFWTLKSATLRGAENAICDFLRREWNYLHPRWLRPGIPDKIPVRENRFLFRTIGNVFDDIGVELSDSGFMSPEFTVSVIFFDGGTDAKQN
ncbi:hypothetical protein [Bacilliculturomica massiliensis]|uniref:hypothetical protein n=1 Tax=Bacilliculturomica massiliensis TaxID=1917867 RepID=UPI0010326269|nr:hypothetical protein [Bacilliculturomica massiliensis]